MTHTAKTVSSDTITQSANRSELNAIIYSCPPCYQQQNLQYHYINTPFFSQQSVIDGSDKKFSGQVINQAAPISISDFLAGISQLAVIGIIETTSIVEAIHREIVLRPLGLLDHKYGRLWTKGIAGRVYNVVRGITSIVGHSLAIGINQYHHLVRHKEKQPIPERLSRVVYVINGVMGDHLVTNHNPIAIPMMFYNSQGDALPLTLYDKYQNPSLKQEIQFPHFKKSPQSFNHDWQLIEQRQFERLSSKITIILHGLCMGYVNWKPSHEKSLGQQILKSQPDTSVLYLNYNTGRRISTNGRNFSELMQALMAKHPHVTEINLIGHSMGGLVCRSALHYGGEFVESWTHKVNKLIMLGTPHHGAVLERIGDTVQKSISKLPFAGALGKLGDIRSTGIIDLRHGSIRDEDWHSLTSRSVLPDSERHITPLPDNVTAYCLAGSLSNEEDDSSLSQVVGDGLVTIESALGEHTEQHTLKVQENHKAIFYGVGHMNLMSDSGVLQQVVDWLVEGS